MLYPFLMIVSGEGMISDKQQKQMSKAMKKMQKRLEELPEEQRKRMKKMMQSMGVKQMMHQGTFKMTFQIKEIHVNVGPPNGQ